MQSARQIMTIGMCLAVGIVADSQAGRVEWVPVSATGPHTIVGNTITLNDSNGMLVTLELRVSNWDPDHDGSPLLSAVQATVESSTYDNGSGTSLAPLTNPTAAAGAYSALNLCTVNQQVSLLGAPCGSGFSNCPAGEFCVPNPDYIFTGHNPLPVLALVSLNYEYGGVAQVGGRMDDGNDYYLGTLKLVIPANAKGVYSIGFINNNNFTFMADEFAVEIPVTQTIPAQIKIFCASVAQCDDQNLCTLDRCSSNVCTNTARPLGFDCSDGLACNGIEVCDGAKVCSAPSVPCVGLPNATCDESLGCVGPGNFNGDESLDLEDWFDFASCLTGPGISGSSPCIPARMDNGTDVDLVDSASFFNLFTGP